MWKKWIVFIQLSTCKNNIAKVKKNFNRILWIKNKLIHKQGEKEKKKVKLISL